MNAQELLVHNSSQGKRAKRLHTSLIDLLAVLVLALQLEGKVICQMSALVVAAQKPEGVWIPDLQAPDIQHTLEYVSRSR